MKRFPNRPSGQSPERLLIVEGSEDFHVLWHLRERQSSAPEFCIADKGNDIELLAAIVPEARVQNRKALGILLDANDSLSSRWDAVSSRLASEDIQTPSVPDPSGTIIEVPEKPRIGIWLMPDNQSAGELEDFIALMIPTNDQVWPLSKCYVDGIPKAERKFSKGKILKAKIHAWLAVREQPRPMGRAITTRDLEIDGDLCQRFATWLTRLFH